MVSSTQTRRGPQRGSISHNGRLIDYEVSHRPAVRRRIHLEINAAGNLRVVAPKRMSPSAIQKTLQHRAHRVARFLLEARARQSDLSELRYTSGEEHYFMGQLFPLEILPRTGSRGRVDLDGGSLRVVTADEQAQHVSGLLTCWYRQQALAHFGTRLTELSKAAAWTRGETPAMRLRLMKRTWGNCSAMGVITLNPHLVKAPGDLIDYVIAHEICHLREHNHGKAFYALQQQLYPGWREAKARLKASGHIYLHV